MGEAAELHIAPRERPILFSGEMVRAILAGKKTQTRRPLNTLHWVPRTKELLRYPFGQVGDRLWVRETWAHYQTVAHVQGRTSSEVSDGRAAYRADGFDTIAQVKEHVRSMVGVACEAVEVRGDAWRPSIHMPRWASRLTLEITGVRVERLQDITESDAIAEGIGTEPRGPRSSEVWYQGALHPVKGLPKVFPFAHQAFESLWDALYGKTTSWPSNPWVWVIEFRHLEEAIHAS